MARPDLISALFYQDPRAAIAWLQRAFDFQLSMLLEDASGAVVHAEMGFGSGAVMLGGEWSEAHQSPRSTNGKCTQTVHVHIETDIQAHFARAKASGAEILTEPTYQFYGDETYSCRDPEGHIWSIAQTVRTVTREEAEAATGLKITGWI